MRLRVLVFAGGGMQHVSGGVGTLMAYLQEAWKQLPGAPEIRAVDSRGQGGRLGGALYFLRACRVLIAQALRGRVDLVHAHMTTRGSVLRKAVLCALAGSFGIPVLLHMHGADFPEFYRSLPKPLRHLARAALGRADAVIVLGRDWRDFLVREAGIDARRIHIVPNAVPRRAAMAPRAPNPVPRLLFLGRIGPRKGVPELIEALARPELRALHWHLTLAGDGDAALYHARAMQLDLSHRVAFVGWLPRQAADELLLRADLVLLPSHHEAMPMAVLEALAAGVAVITTPVGAIPEYLRDGESVRFVPPGDVAALAAAIAGLLQDAPARARLAAAGHRAFGELLTLDAVATRLAQLYRDVHQAGVRAEPALLAAKT